MNPVSLALDLSCLAKVNLTGIGVYAKNLTLNLLKFKALNIKGFYSLKYKKHKELIHKHVSVKTFQYVPIITSLFSEVKVTHGLDNKVKSIGKSKKVITIHDMVFLHPELVNTLWAKEAYKRLTNQLKNNRVDLIITVSDFIKNEMLNEFRAYEGRIHTIYHGADHIDTDTFGLPKFNFPYIYCLGTIEKRKNLLVLLEAFQSLQTKFPDLNLVVSGSRGFGGEEIITKLKGKNIIFLGYTRDIEIKNLIQNAIIFTYPSLYEGFGIPIIESMKLGTPVLTSNFGAMKEISSNAAMLVDTNNKIELTEVLEHMLESEPIRHKLSKAGRVRASEFTWGKAAAKTFNVYNSLIEH